MRVLKRSFWDYDKPGVRLAWTHVIEVDADNRDTLRQAVEGSYLSHLHRFLEAIDPADVYGVIESKGNDMVSVYYRQRNAGEGVQ